MKLRRRMPALPYHPIPFRERKSLDMCGIAVATMLRSFRKLERGSGELSRLTNESFWREVGGEDRKKGWKRRLGCCRYLCEVMRQANGKSFFASYRS
jgi:hypothetical protein